ncbi:MAG: type II methionyl aminopeptidase [Promethearchaeota archaeon]|nr:MAG: type II methionyl aminopeptidase [Candidatus Lokiarchaeota archaeon]
MEEKVENYIKAGKAVIAAKRLARKLTKPGVPFLEIANKCEEEILKQGAGLSFPVNISLNEIAAHYSPPIGDKSIVPEKGLLKVDIGSHFKGYIADSAITINIDGDPLFQNYCNAAKAGLDAAIELFKPGTRLYELGEVIADAIIQRGLKPITNLGGHQLEQYDLHAGAFIPNYKQTTHTKVLKPGDAYACEPFATSGRGQVRNGKEIYIYRFARRKTKNMPYELQSYMNKIEKSFKHLPFSPRWIKRENLIPESKIERVINVFVRKRVLDQYNVLIERTNQPVSQFEHTIVLDNDGNTIVTTRDPNLE